MLTDRRRGTSRALVLAGCALAWSALPRALPVHAQSGRTLVVALQDLRNDEGVVRGALYDQAGTWLDHAQVADRCSGPISHGQARCVFRHAPAGAVAFAGMHDEDRNGDLNRDALGLPEEGYAFSNDVRPTVGPPSFESALLPATARRCTVHVHYGL